MKVLVLILSLTLSVSIANASPVKDVCEKQIRGYMSANVEGDIKSIYFVFPSERNERNSRAWIRHDSCEGYFVFNLRADEEDCSMYHYGRIRNYIQDVWTTRDCKL